MSRILVVDDEAGIREFLADALEMAGHEVTPAASAEEAARALDRRSFDLVFTDLRMPGKDGMWLLRKVRAEQPEVEVVVLTAHGSVDSAVEAMKLGAFEYLQKPIGGPDELCLVAARALERRRLRDAETRAERVAADPGAPRLGHGDPAMVPVVQALEKVARTSATVLLLGESGTGKELAARTVHALSDRRDRPFMAVNCAAITETLLESELFGHEKGAFTGANERRRGRIELAEGGTFFLDEVGELRLELQAKLLRVLQERRFEPVGGTRTIEVDVRWIAATNRDLKSMMSEGRFRDDLFHRLAVFPIRLPALRERPADIIPLARDLLGRIGPELKLRRLSLSEAAEQQLLRWHWPGNVRELANVLERAAILSDGQTIQPEHIWLEAGGSGAAAAPGEGGEAEVRTLAEMEKDAIARALRAVSGNRRRAAELLGIGERTLYDKLRRYGLD
ncbi:MAG TPA: sigma-54 dependent transcriptional regulator [Kofleriaceae bacterium]|nr:sigma-54 dependent transcriptional regulator [Kofleriaceae bacterium]